MLDFVDFPETKLRLFAVQCKWVVAFVPSTTLDILVPLNSNSLSKQTVEDFQ